MDAKYNKAGNGQPVQLSALRLFAGAVMATALFSACGSDKSPISNPTATATAIPTAPATGQHVVTIPELGIQLTVPDSIHDLVYVINTRRLGDESYDRVALLSTRTVTGLDPSCGPEGWPLGLLSRNPGTAPGPFTELGELVKQFADYYIVYTHPQATCSADSAVNDSVVAGLNALKDALSTVTLSE